ncbi:hypothetical protein Q0Z83_018640 [Actinoplanes sichuanensis]|uniref:Uncharacterized protein n=1 Tax=Actinoplanes sichuanensis TaxID=512349 RepID=A0ABW4A8P1_9ACTN|nr:hypothetical protein [Actinoplanes sichuanensis]BEL03673.1 hypothetical protein Q0Z83_018640 [Actinoplanes sichuanensis]
MKHAVLFFAALVGSVSAYLYGMWVSHLLDLRALSEYCSGKPLGHPSSSWSWVPLSHRCHWADGTYTELVPVHVNVLAFGLLAVVAGCYLRVIWSAGSVMLRRQGRGASERRQTESGGDEDVDAQAGRDAIGGEADDQQRPERRP